MALHHFEKMYEGYYSNGVWQMSLRRLSRIMDWEWPITGKVTTIRPSVRSGAFIGPWRMNMRNDGAWMFDSSNNFFISGSTKFALKTGLAIDVVKYKLGTLEWQSKSQGDPVGPCTLQFTIEDGIYPAEETVVVTTASIANLTTDNLTALLGKNYKITKISANRDCRVRTYLAASYRTADASRPIGEDPDREIEHGVIADIVLEGGNLTWDLAPPALGSDRESVRTGDIAIAVQKRDGGANSTVQVTFTVIKEEV